MGTVLEQAPPSPEVDDTALTGEAPVSSGLLDRAIVRDLVRIVRRIRGDNEQDESKKLANDQIFFKIPNEATGVPDRVSLEDSTFWRNPDGPGFGVTYPQRVEVEPGRFRRREKKVVLTVTMAATVLGSVIAYRHKK